MDLPRAHMLALKVTYHEREPWIFEEIPGNITTVKGVFIDIYESLSKTKKYSYSIVATPDGQFGNRNPDGSWTGMVGMLYSNKADIAGPLALSEERAQALTYASYPIDSHDFVIITGLKDSTEQEQFHYFETFRFSVWMLFVFSWIVASLIITVIHRSFVKSKGRSTFGIVTWKLLGNFVSQDLGAKSVLRSVWNLTSLRLLLGSWLFGPVLIFNYTFQGTMVSSFATRVKKPVVNSLKDVAAKRSITPVIMKGGYEQYFFEKNDGGDREKIWKRMKKNMISDDIGGLYRLLDKVEKGKHVFMTSRMSAVVWMADRYRLAGKCGLIIAEESFGKTFVSLGLRQSLPYEVKHDINMRIARAIQGDIATKWTVNIRRFNEICQLRRRATSSRSLASVDVAGVFILWSLGLCAAFVILVLEIVSAKWWSKARKSQKKRF